MIKYEDIESEFCVVKVIVLMETEPLTDNFEQILMTQEQMKKVLDLIEGFMPHKGSSFQILTNGNPIKIPDIMYAYRPEYIEKKRLEADENENVQ
jgi:hypothetical protein